MRVNEISVKLDRFGGVSFHIQVNFIKNRFVFLEWRNREHPKPFSNLQWVRPGSIEEFKKEISLLKIWEWEPNYRKESGIILEGEYWSVKLTTDGQVYMCEGGEDFPMNWGRFCLALERLTGITFR
ncbi:hypothetical protein [Bacillus sp. JJ1764]|uniref:hypothetical protein n=1 Tax=Bacillus sp. JJ1764 TaxID=3122964 RepID=UPI002FFF1E71